MNVIKRLTTAFNALSLAQRRNLIAHARAGTPIACGKNASTYALNGMG